MFSPSINDKIRRLKLKENKLKSKNKLVTKRRNKIINRIETLTQKQQKNVSNIQTNSKEDSNKNHSIIRLLIKPILIICYFGMIIIFSIGFGYSQSSDKTSFDTINTASLSNLQANEITKYSFEEYIVLFENSEYMIISPFIVEEVSTGNKNATLFTSFQIKIKNENIPKINKNIKNITVNSDANDLEKYEIINN